MKEKVENIFMYSKSGLLTKNIGTEGEVGIDKTLRNDLFEKGKSTRILVGHNHPHGSLLSDIDMYKVFVDNGTDIFAVGPNGNCHIMTLPIMSKNQKRKLKAVATLQVFKSIPAVIPCLLLSEKKQDMIAEFLRKGMEKIFEKRGAIFKEFKVDELYNYLTQKIDK